MGQVETDAARVPEALGILFGSLVLSTKPFWTLTWSIAGPGVLVLWCSFSGVFALETTVWRNLGAGLGRHEREELTQGADKGLAPFVAPQVIPSVMNCCHNENWCKA